MAPHSSTFAWRIPWTEEPGRLQSMGSWRVGHDWATSLSLFCPSQPQNWTQVSCIAGGFLTSWATREAHLLAYIWAKSYNTKPLIIKCSISYVIYWELYRRWKTEWLNGYRMIGSVSVSGVCFVITQLTGSGSSLLLSSIMREYPTTYCWPGQISKFKSL